MQEVAIALESYRQKKPCATLHPWLGCESLDRQLFSFEREHNVPFRSKRAQSFSDGENSGPNPSLHTAPLHSQTRNQARQRSEKTRVSRRSAVRKRASLRRLFRRNSTSKVDSGGKMARRFERTSAPGAKARDDCAGLMRGLKPPPPSGLNSSAAFPENAAQGLKPYSFCWLYGTTEVVP
jgi:hypothetical protein